MKNAVFWDRYNCGIFIQGTKPTLNHFHSWTFIQAITSLCIDSLLSNDLQIIDDMTAAVG
jgi:hypothetical protein